MNTTNNHDLDSTAGNTPMSCSQTPVTGDPPSDVAARENRQPWSLADWTAAAAVLCLVVLPLVVAVSIAIYQGRPRYLPEGGVVTGDVIDYIEPDGTVTTCIPDPSIPAPEGHPCQKHGH